MQIGGTNIFLDASRSKIREQMIPLRVAICQLADKATERLLIKSQRFVDNPRCDPLSVSSDYELLRKV